jgi:uncharacterized protein involved in exopolysaccharide biosynthesis
MLMQADADLRELDRRERELRDRATILQAELDRLRLMPAAQRPTGRSSAAARLETARLQLTELQLRFTPSHPDVVYLRNEIAVLEEIVAEQGDVAAGESSLAQERDRLAAELATLRARYNPDHPDVQRTIRALEETEAAMAEGAAAADAVVGTDPALLPVEAQLAVVRSQLDALDRLREDARERIQRYEERLARTVAIEPEYNRLVTAIRDARAQRDVLVEREQAARLGEAVESEERGERFSLIEPATLPGAPVEPNRKLIVLAGLVLAGGAGAGSVTARHFLDDRVAGPGDITKEIGFQPLGMVPNITTPTERLATYARRLAVLLVMVGSVGTAGWYAHTRVMPLDTAGYIAWQRVTDRVMPYLPSDLRAQLRADER